ncbi:hypothetical protein Bpfe_006681 [Biomphalaria pfeifferi]|uniref:Uncharacterized protein n=1 Tax=Biomphalaria pfeifferi TaxID=112525 RepID=A0AAD8FHV7_BIOPF|nr:hypothetical protein Bpfe_006681 [Biomphalaria pfeifferi]
MPNTSTSLSRPKAHPFPEARFGQDVRRRVWVQRMTRDFLCVLSCSRVLHSTALVVAFLSDLSRFVTSGTGRQVLTSHARFDRTSAY